MPLALGDVSTERVQAIVFDPAVAAQVREARHRRDVLIRHGFSLSEESDGKIVLDPPKRDPNIGCFRIMSENGDERLVWDRRDLNQVREAYKTFRDFVAKGYRGYATLAGGKKGPRIDDFDPGLEEILMLSPTMPG